LKKWYLILALCLSVLFANPVYAQENTNNHKEKIPKEVLTSLVTSNYDKKAEVSTSKATVPSLTASSGIDLEFYIPRNWDDKMVISKTLGQRYTDASFSPDDTLYFSYAYTNNGTTITPYATIQSTLYVDGIEKTQRLYEGTLDIDEYISGIDINIGKLSAGRHTIKMVLDTNNVIDEFNESNNEYSVSVTVQGATSMDLEFYNPRGWDDKLVVTKTLGQRYTDTSFSPDEAIYLNYAYENSGTTVTPNATIQDKIYIDGVEKSRRYYTGTLDMDTYISGEDINIGTLSPGTHIVKVVLDTTNVINETNESNNEYSVTIYVRSTASIDLEPYKPNAWGGKLILTKNPGQRSTDTSFSPNDELYGSYAYWNSGTTAAPDTTVQSVLYVDNIPKFTLSCVEPIKPGYYVTGNDQSIGKLSAGNHTIKMVIDTTNAVNETNESNNEYSITVNVAPDTVVVHPTSVSLNKSSTTLTMGYTEQLVETVSPSDATNKNVTWKSSNPSVATVDSTGLITAVSPGENVRITVTTTDGNIQASCYVTVTESSNTVKTLTADPSSLNLAIDDYEYITLTATFTDGSREDVTESATWASTNPQFASVDDYGMVTGVEDGFATITGTYGGKTATIPVTVGSPKTVKTLSADPSSLNLTLDEEDYITLTATYTDGSKEDVTESATWNSSKPQFASVDDYGMVTGLANGSTTITGTYGGKTATIPVTVSDDSTPVLVGIIAQPDNVYVGYLKTQAVKIYAEYSDDTKVDVTTLAKLVSADPAIASVTRGTIKGLCVGDTSISVTYLDETTEILVTVTPPVTKLTADPSALSLLIEESQTIELTATFKNKTEDVVTEFATWKSSNPKIATVDEYGEVTGQALGSTTITGSYGGKTATIKVNVTPEIDHFIVKPG